MKKPAVAFLILLFSLGSFLYSTNVIVISVCTLRADHLGCYGYPGKTSPHIDQFAKDAVLFTRCYTPSPLTGPGFASVLTSLPPFKHGLKRNGLSVFDHVRLLPEFLKEFGYDTGAVVSSWTLNKKLAGLDRGFDAYNEVFTRRRWFGLLNAESEAPDVNRVAFRWLYQNRENPFFLWVLYVDPHAPYRRHKEFDHGYDTASSGVHPEGVSQRRIRRYDTEVGFVDHHIGELLAKIKEYGLYKDALIVFLADHGESFGEHGYYGHGRNLYNPGLHVPLIVKLPGNADAGSEIHRNVSLLDVAPTILDRLGHPLPEPMEGKNLFDPDRKERPLFFEAYRGAVHGRSEGSLHLRVRPIRHGLLMGDTKLIHDNGFEAYDLQSDRFELRNLYGVSEPDEAGHSEMTGLLKSFMKDIRDFITISEKYHKQRSKLDEEDLEKLRSLGYIK